MASSVVFLFLEESYKGLMKLGIVCKMGWFGIRYANLIERKQRLWKGEVFGFVI